MNDLKKCPFCGSDKIKIIKDGANWQSGIACKCMNVYFFKKGQNVNHCASNSPQPIIDAWNQRQDDWINTAFPPRENCLVLVRNDGEVRIKEEYTAYEYTDGLNLYELGECYKIINEPQE